MVILGTVETNVINKNLHSLPYFNYDTTYHLKFSTLTNDNSTTIDVLYLDTKLFDLDNVSNSYEINLTIHLRFAILENVTINSLITNATLNLEESLAKATNVARYKDTHR